MNLLFRYATVKDADLLAEMGRRLYQDQFGPDNSKENMHAYLSLSFTPAKLHDEIQDSDAKFLLAYEQSDIVGYAKLQASAGPECVSGKNPIELVRMYVERKLIGKGYGSTLMCRCLEDATKGGYDTMWLDVWERNPRAIMFYRRWGFAEVGQQDYVLGDDVQNDLIMARSLGQAA